MKGKCTIPTPLGEMTAMIEGDAVAGLRFVGQKYEPRDMEGPVEDPRHPLCIELGRQLDAYFGGRLRQFDIPLAPSGTPFQKAVWELLKQIRPGTTTTYGALAAVIAGGNNRPFLARAVGAAVGRNPIAIIVPCHRVIGADGSLTGYAGGLDRKSAFLALEKESPQH